MSTSVGGMLALSRALTELGAIAQARATEDRMNAAAQQMEDKIKAGYPVTTPGTPDLAPATQAARVRAGYTPNDPRLASGKERDSVTHSVVRDGGDLVAYAGIPEGSDTSAGALANEYGTLTGIPPRPIYKPAMQELEASLVDEFSSLLKGTLEGR